MHSDDGFQTASSHTSGTFLARFCCENTAAFLKSGVRTAFTIAWKGDETGELFAGTRWADGVDGTLSSGASNNRYRRLLENVYAVFKTEKIVKIKTTSEA